MSNDQTSKSTDHNTPIHVKNIPATDLPRLQESWERQGTTHGMSVGAPLEGNHVLDDPEWVGIYSITQG